MKYFDRLYTWNGERIRVIIAGDVVALPIQGWSLDGFGRSISEDWLVHSGKLPGPIRRRTALAGAIVRALDARAADLPVPDPGACRMCKGSGKGRPLEEKLGGAA